MVLAHGEQMFLSGCRAGDKSNGLIYVSDCSSTSFCTVMCVTDEIIQSKSARTMLLQGLLTQSVF